MISNQNKIIGILTFFIFIYLISNLGVSEEEKIVLGTPQPETTTQNWEGLCEGQSVLFVGLPDFIGEGPSYSSKFGMGCDSLAECRNHIPLGYNGEIENLQCCHNYEYQEAIGVCYVEK